MNEFFKKIVSRITGLWAGWGMQQRIILIESFRGTGYGIRLQRSNQRRECS